MRMLSFICLLFYVPTKFANFKYRKRNEVDYVMEKKNLVYEGKAKKVFETENPELLIVSYKDDATAFNGLKKGTISGKGIINNQMSNMLMQLLEKQVLGF